MKVTYRLFGIPVWSVTRSLTDEGLEKLRADVLVSVNEAALLRTEEESLYARFAKRFGEEMNAAFARLRGGVQ